jgi:endonuclease/exonuclease/phosphatase family metal-dependent hydrolase
MASIHPVSRLLAAGALIVLGGALHVRANPDPVDRAPGGGPTASAVRNKFGWSQPKARTPGAIRIATYNVLNLFDHADDPSLEGEFDDEAMATSDARCRAIAAAIKAVDADVIALQEVESQEALRWFRDTYLPDAGYEHIVSRDVGYYRGVEQAVLSRFPITRTATWPRESLDDVRRSGPGFEPVPSDRRTGLQFQRSPLCVDVRISDDYTLTMFVVHHKSGRDNRWHREAEALQIVEYVDRMQREDHRRNIVVLGDFNAAPWDKSVRVYLAAGMIDTLAHRIIPRWRDADQTEANLFKTHESDRVLDYILLNSAAHRELVVGSAHVYGTLYDEEYDWREDPYPTGYAADHYPVIIDLHPEDRL